MAKQQVGKQDSHISSSLEQLLHPLLHCQAPISLLFPTTSIYYISCLEWEKAVGEGAVSQG